MKKLVLSLLPAIALFLATTVAGQADQFTELQNSPKGYWVPSPTPPPPPGYYYAGPPPYYYGPPRPYYYGGPPIFFGFDFGFHSHHHHY